MSDRKTLVDEKTYRFFKGSDWPEFNDFIENNYHIDKSIEDEINDFMSIMEQKYDDIATPKTIELSLSNQKRQSQVFFNKQYTESRCRIPWETLGVNNNGNAYICASPSWIPIFVGNLFESDNIYNILNSQTSLKIRQEILAGRYYYCNTRICDFFNFKDTAKYQSQPTIQDDLN